MSGFELRNRSGALAKQNVFRTKQNRKVSATKAKYPAKGGVSRILSGVGNFSGRILNWLSSGESRTISASDRAFRIWLIGLLIFGSGAGITFRLHALQNRDHSKWMKIAARQHQTSVEIQGARGTVLDSDGRILAVSVEAVSLGVHPREVKDVEKTAAALSRLTDLSQSDLAQKIKSDRSFVWLARGLPQKIEHQLGDLALPGVVPIREFRRYYPQGDLASQVLGRISRDGAGQAGVELGFNSELAAASLNVPVRRDARGRLVAASTSEGSAKLSDAFLKLPDLFEQPGTISPAVLHREQGYFRSEGGQIELTVDSYVQNVLEEEFAAAFQSAKAKRVYGMVMDADSGEILGLAQVPRFNPNRFENVSPEELRNLSIQDSFEPGSTLKPLVAAAALGAGVVRPEEIMNCENGRYPFASGVIRDSHPVGIVTFREALVRSSNICMTKVGARLGKVRLHDALESFGLGTPTAITLPGEARGILRATDTWRDIDVATHSFGQGVSVTALQLVRAYAAIANGGELVQPRIVRGAAEDGPRKRIISPEVAATLSEILSGVTEDEHGTGKEAAILGLKVSGKTGTAQKVRLDKRGYDPERILASFIGYIDGRPIGVERKLVMFVAVDEPGVQPRWGGVLAAPVFRHSMERILSHLLTSGSRPLQTARLHGLPSDLESKPS